MCSTETRDTWTQDGEGHRNRRPTSERAQSLPLTPAHADFRGDVAGDPSGWARALADIDSVRDATRSRGAHIVLAVVSEAPLGDVPEDRAQSLIRQAGVERRWVSLRPMQTHQLIVHAVAALAADSCMHASAANLGSDTHRHPAANQAPSDIDRLHRS